MLLRISIVALTSLLLASCAAPTTQQAAPVAKSALQQEVAQQQRLIIDQWRADVVRVHKIVGPLFRAAAPLCAPDKVGPTAGMFSIETLENFDKDFRSAAAVELRLTKALTFTYIEPDGPLAKAGVQEGDQLLSFNGKTYEGRRGYGAFVKDYLKLRPGDGITFVTSRVGEQRTVQVAPEMLPKQILAYKPMSDEFNASSDGEVLTTHRGLLRGADDMVLSMIMAHETAHSCQLHIEALKTNVALGTAVDILFTLGGADTEGAFRKRGAEAFSQDFEREADYVGLYYIARAGLPMNEAIQAMRVMTLATSPQVLRASYASSHPSNPERFLNLEATKAEIEAKIKNGEPLVPNPRRR